MHYIGGEIWWGGWMDGWIDREVEGWMIGG